MSFTIKCDKCGNVYKYSEQRTKRRSGKAIVITTKTEGDVPDWLVFECVACGHTLEDL